MSARHKLNALHLQMALLIAAVAGGISGSWIVFLIALALGIALAVHCRHIR